MYVWLESKHQLTPETFLIGKLQALPVTNERLQIDVGRDLVLSRILQFTREGWPAETEVTLKPYTEGDCNV